MCTFLVREFLIFILTLFLIINLFINYSFSCKCKLTFFLHLWIMLTIVEAHLQDETRVWTSPMRTATRFLVLKFYRTGSIHKEKHSGRSAVPVPSLQSVVALLHKQGSFILFHIEEIVIFKCSIRKTAAYVAICNDILEFIYKKTCE